MTRYLRPWIVIVSGTCDNPSTLRGWNRVERRENRVILTFEANGFLKHMVRNITGTLVQVGLGRMEPEDVRDNLEALSRDNAPPKAPPQGLMLVKVYYQNNVK
jgi:tRNA pseudouridine38-40 synthase